MHTEQASDAGFSIQEETKRCMVEYIDRFHFEIFTRTKGLKEISSMLESTSVEKYQPPRMISFLFIDLH